MDDPRGGAPKGRKKGRRPENALTVSFVRTVAKPGRYCDGNGLYLQVDPSGARRWVQRLRVHGRDRTLGLGGCALAPLAEARAKALDNRRLARAGGDPLARGRAAAGVPSFADAAQTVCALHRPSWRSAKHAAQWLATLERYAFPRLMNTSDRSQYNTGGYPGRQYIYLKGDWGSMEFGNWIGADSGLNLCPLACTYKGYGGLDTPYKSYIIKPAGAIDRHINPFWFNQSPKAVYYTPVIGGSEAGTGFQAGISYTPTDNDFFAPPPSPTSEADGKQKDIIGLGSQWNGDFGGTTVGFSAVGAISDGATNADGSQLEGLGYYELTGKIGFGGVVFAGTWWDFGDGNAPKGSDREWKGWALDASYAFGPYGLEVQYAHAEQSATIPAKMSSDFDGWNVSLGYTIAPGLRWYGEVTRGSFDVMGTGEEAGDGEYTGTVFLSGLYLNF